MILRTRERGVSWFEYASWFALLAVVTLLMAAARTRLNQAHVALAYLLIVQGASARGGRPLGVSLAAVAFVCFDVVFLPPYGTFVIQDPLNWLVLVAFLGTSVLAAQLLYRARAEANAARERAAEIDRLAALGAETLNVARAEDALAAIVSVIRASLGLEECAVYGESDRAVPAAIERVLDRGENGVEYDDGSTMFGVGLDDAGGRTTTRIPTAVLRPLQVRGHTVGVLRIANPHGLRFTPEQRRVLDALSYYAALGVERVRLVAAAERAATLQEAHRVKDAVLASVSHDLRTPLTTIKALAHEIGRDGDARAETIEEEADRLNSFVAQVLDLSRIASGTAVRDVQANEAEDLLGAAAQSVAGRLGGRELRIEVCADDAGPLMFGRFDFSQTLRALVNLIENAAKYSPPAAPIDLSARRDGTWLAFDVADHGPGVPAAERERIFEPFYRPAGGPPDVGGAGLGLSIARGVAEAQGGSIAVADRAEGGSVFTLRVPAIAASDMEFDTERLEPDRTAP